MTWEAKDGLHYRFNQKETRNGEVDEEIRGEAHLDGPGKAGAADFDKPTAARAEAAGRRRCFRALTRSC